MDGYGRVIDYLRISVTDRCNERCLYCMPEGYKGWAQKADHLTAEEIVRVAAAAAGIGFRNFRLTGGEPTIRPDLVDIAAGIGRLPGMASLGVSTNGTRLASLSGPLKDAGVTSLNISLDALDPTIYRQITGGDFPSVMAGIQAAISAGFPRIKLNCVLMRGVNEQEIWPLIVFAAERALAIRFIELMPLSNEDVLTEKNFLSINEVRERLAERDNLVPLDNPGLGCGPARYHRLTGLGATVGFIGAITTPDFCGSCNKIRLTADGKIRPCLGRHNELDLLASVRNGGGIAGVLQEAIALKPEDHEFSECYKPGRPMTAIGG
ncbi:MAG TPA: GTP 3',8-cyclase MoaA [Terrimicrobiaceae bacterium]|nr:GTP 3',8-cyclase MoaA [Terrimicrobiaceae bacterium]